MAEHPFPILGEELQWNVRDPNPFQLFPELVWQNILNNLKSHSDLWNVLEAFSELKVLIKWAEVLFDQVLPLIFKELDKRDVLACRKTCKWWKKAVDNFLGNHPSQKPYDPSSFATITDYRYSTLHDLVQTNVKGTEAVRQVRQDAQQLLERHSIPPTFVGKSVWFQMGQLYSQYERSFFFDEMDQLQTPELEFGTSIWYVEFTRGFNNVCYPEYQHKLQMWLENLPNLKSLSISNIHPISITLADSDFAELVEQLGTNFSLPDLPHLESLELTDSRTVKSFSGEVQIPLANFSHALISKYAPQLRKLSIAINLWRVEYVSRLENLTELSLDLTANQGLEDFCAEVCLLISSLHAPNLEKLEIKLNERYYMEEILEAIQIRRIKVLTIHTSSFIEYIGVYQKPIITSVKALILRANVDYGNGDIPSPFILECFPELEYLEIRYGVYIDGDDDDDGQEEEDDWISPRRRITAESRPPEDSNDEDSANEDIVVWKVFPKLKVFVQDGESFRREMYERSD